jgi:hypothetical protein
MHRQDVLTGGGIWVTPWVCLRRVVFCAVRHGFVQNAVQSFISTCFIRYLTQVSRLLSFTRLTRILLENRLTEDMLRREGILLPTSPFIFLFANHVTLMLVQHHPPFICWRRASSAHFLRLGTRLLRVKVILCLVYLLHWSVGWVTC